MATVTKAIYCFDKSIRYYNYHVSSCIDYMFCRCHSYGEGVCGRDDIMMTCRHAWNAMLPILATPINRAGLKGSGVSIISNVLKILGKNGGEVSGCGQWVWSM